MKSALLIGVAYNNTEYELPGCINDINRIKKYLRARGFSKVETMQDDLRESSADYPSRNNVITRFYRSIKDLGPADHLWIHFSGHGFFVKSGNTVATSSGGKISKNSTECILLRDAASADLVDIDENNTLCDEQLVRMFHHAPTRAHVFVTIDACNSGSMFDLRYNMQMKETSESKAEYTLVERHERELAQNVVIFTAVNHHSFAWDAPSDNGRSYGVFTTCLLDILEQKQTEQRELSWMDILYLVDARLKLRTHKQDPQLSVPVFDLAEEACWA